MHMEVIVFLALGSTLYAIIMPLKYYVDIYLKLLWKTDHLLQRYLRYLKLLWKMEHLLSGANDPFSIIVSNVFKTYFFLEFFSMLPKNRKKMSLSKIAS